MSVLQIPSAYGALIIQSIGNGRRGRHTRVGYHPLPCLSGASVASHFFHMTASGNTSYLSQQPHVSRGSRNRIWWLTCMTACFLTSSSYSASYILCELKPIKQMARLSVRVSPVEPWLSDFCDCDGGVSWVTVLRSLSVFCFLDFDLTFVLAVDLLVLAVDLGRL